MLSVEPCGILKDLKANNGTTMWFSETEKCPFDSSHKIVETGKYFICNECGVYWNKFIQYNRK